MLKESETMNTEGRKTNIIIALLVPLTMIVIALGGFVCTRVATKTEVEAVRQDVRLILQHLLNDRVASE